jgi:hypothetical protein
VGSYAYAEQVCGNRIVLLINNNLCGGTVPTYNPPSGCIVNSSSITGCIAVYQVCCPVEGTPRYTDSGAQVITIPSVTIGTEYDVAASYYESAKDGVNSPACQSPYITNSEMKGYVYDVKPSPSDYTKSDVRITMWNRVGCEKFTNTTAVPLDPISGGGGSGSGSVDLTTTNDLLNQIKLAIESAGDKGDNQGVIDAVNNIKALLDTGGVANPNTLLQAIKDVLTGIDAKDAEGNQLLVQIRDILQSGGGFTNYSGGGTVNIDMTETNGLLTDVKNSIISIGESIISLVSSVSGDSSLGGYVDNTASKPAYSSSFFAGTPTLESYKASFNAFTKDMMSTPLFGLVGGFFGAVPNGGSSVVSFNGGVYGSHIYDFSSWGSVLSVLRGLVLVMFAAASVRIIFLKGGGG